MGLYRVTDGVYIGKFSDVQSFRFVDLITGADYYADTNDYEYAAIEHGQRLCAFDTMMDDMYVIGYIYANDDIPTFTARPGHWRDGKTPEWVRRDVDKIWFEMTYERWIIRGYVDCGEPNGSTTVNK